jgi:hypothetical protein
MRFALLASLLLVFGSCGDVTSTAAGPGGTGKGGVGGELMAPAGAAGATGGSGKGGSGSGPGVGAGDGGQAGGAGTASAARGGAGGMGSSAGAGGAGGTQPSCSSGNEHCPCVGNSSCNAGLTCQSGLCAKGSASGGTGGAGGCPGGHCPCMTTMVTLVCGSGGTPSSNDVASCVCTGAGTPYPCAGKVTCADGAGGGGAGRSGAAGAGGSAADPNPTFACGTTGIRCVKGETCMQDGCYGGASCTGRTDVTCRYVDSTNTYQQCAGRVCTMYLSTSTGGDVRGHLSDGSACLCAVPLTGVLHTCSASDSCK